MLSSEILWMLFESLHISHKFLKDKQFWEISERFFPTSDICQMLSYFHFFVFLRATADTFQSIALVYIFSIGKSSAVCVVNTKYFHIFQGVAFFQVCIEGHFTAALKENSNSCSIIAASITCSSALCLLIIVPVVVEVTKL